MPEPSKNAFPVPSEPVTPEPVPASNFLPRVALALSIFAFIVPIGIAAIVLGHMTGSRTDPNPSAENHRVLARAALWIAYLQLALVSFTVLVALSLFQETFMGFQSDPLLQRSSRPSDEVKPLDDKSAREAEETAQTVLTQLMAIEESARSHSPNGSYACHVEQLTGSGEEGWTDAEKRAFALRVAESPYLFAVSSCNPRTGGIETAAYVLTTVPIPPRLPDGSNVFCADQTGVLRHFSGGTSLDCIRKGEPIR